MIRKNLHAACLVKQVSIFSHNYFLDDFDLKANYIWS